jgi:hypothetical protein
MYTDKSTFVRNHDRRLHRTCRKIERMGVRVGGICLMRAVFTDRERSYSACVSDGVNHQQVFMKAGNKIPV